jgi:hypothetical protein
VVEAHIHDIHQVIGHRKATDGQYSGGGTTK